MEESIWGMQNSKSGEGMGVFRLTTFSLPFCSHCGMMALRVSGAAVMGGFGEECSYTHSVPTCCWATWQFAIKVPDILKYLNSLLLKILNFFFLTFSAPSLSVFVPRVFCIFCGAGVDDLSSLLITAWFKAKAFKYLLLRKKFIYFWLCWVFLAALRLFLAAARGRLPRCSVRASRCRGFPCRRAQALELELSSCGAWA